ncbi:MAG: molybdopterin cofactor-binding domain-containing protein, partial [Pyrinomonadaceae bacterium]
MTVKAEMDRRSFIKATLIASGALLVEAALPMRSRAEERFGLAAAPAADFQPNAFIKLAPDGKVTIVVGQAEMGQGVLTSLPQIVADELEVDWNDVDFEHGPAGQAFANPMLGSQITGGSSSVKAFFDPLRKSAASVREMLVSAAA